MPVRAPAGAASPCAPDTPASHHADTPGRPFRSLPCTARADEAALFFRRYRREEMKIQAWENRRRQKAELEMKMTEV